MSALIPALLYPHPNLRRAEQIVDKYRAQLRDVDRTEWEQRLSAQLGVKRSNLEFQRSLAVVMGDVSVEEELEWRKKHFNSHHIIHNNQTVYPLLPDHLTLYRDTSITLLGGRRIPSVLHLDDAQLRELYLWVCGKPPGVAREGVLLPEWKHFKEVMEHLIWWGKTEVRGVLLKLNIKALDSVSIFVDTHRTNIFKGTQAPSLEEARDFLYRVEAFGDNALKNYMAGAMSQFLNRWRES